MGVQKGRKLFIVDVIAINRPILSLVLNVERCTPKNRGPMKGSLVNPVFQKRRFPNMQNLIFVFGIIILGYLILESYFNRKEVQKQQEKIQEKLESLKRSIEERKTINDEVEV